MKDMLVRDMVYRAARRFPDKEAIIFGDARLTFSQVRENANRLAHGLLNEGFKKGDAIAIISSNCPEYVEIYIGIANAGLVAVPLNFRLLPGDLTNLINHSGAKAVIFGKNQTNLMADILPKTPAVEKIYVLGEKKENYTSYAELTNNNLTTEPDVDIDEEDLAIICYTSGTTGQAKGVMVCHRSIAANLTNQMYWQLVKAEDSQIYAFPMFHIVITSVIASLAMGNKQVLFDFDPTTALELIQKERPTSMSIPVALLHMLLNHPNFKSYDLSSLRYMAFGAGALIDKDVREIVKVFGPQLKGMLTNFGLTEGCSLILGNYFEGPFLPGFLEKTEEELRNYFTSGRELVNVQVRLVDDNDVDVPNGQIGEIIAKGPNVMQGYWKNEEMTRETLRGGWLHTGDLGVRNAEGYISIVDRKKDMIKTGGENVYSKEVEDVLYTHPAILETAIIGVPDSVWGEAIKAVVVLKQGLGVLEQELINFCKERIASFKVPKSVDFRSEPLPRSTTGKVLKYVLREQYKNEQQRIAN